MKKRAFILRAAGLCMLAVAVLFVAFALTHPELGCTLRIGPIVLDWKAWRACFAAYTAVTAGLLIAFFFQKDAIE